METSKKQRKTMQKKNKNAKNAKESASDNFFLGFANVSSNPGESEDKCANAGRRERGHFLGGNCLDTSVLIFKIQQRKKMGSKGNEIM